MSIALLVVGAALIVSPRWMRARFSLLSAAESTRIAATALVSGVIVVEAGVVAIALPTVFRAVGAPHVAHLCEEALVHLAPGGPAVGWLAAILAVGIPATALHAVSNAWRGARSLHVDSWLGEHEDRGSYELVTLPTSRVMALSVPGSWPQVVVSDGLIELLDAAELDAVIAHELAHHELRHHWLLALAVAVELAFLPLPGARRSARVLRDEVERSADEKAAETSRGPLPVSAALHALAPCSTATDKAEPVESVANRLRSLSRRGRLTKRGARMLTYSPAAAFGLIGIALAAVWVTEAHHVLALGGYCYS